MVPRSPLFKVLGSVSAVLLQFRVRGLKLTDGSGGAIPEQKFTVTFYYSVNGWHSTQQPIDVSVYDLSKEGLWLEEHDFLTRANPSAAPTAIDMYESHHKDNDHMFVSHNSATEWIFSVFRYKNMVRDHTALVVCRKSYRMDECQELMFGQSEFSSVNGGIFVNQSFGYFGRDPVSQVYQFYSTKEKDVALKLWEKMATETIGYSRSSVRGYNFLTHNSNSYVREALKTGLRHVRDGNVQIVDANVDAFMNKIAGRSDYSVSDSSFSSQVRQALHWDSHIDESEKIAVKFEQREESVSVYDFTGAVQNLWFTWRHGSEYSDPEKKRKYRFLTKENKKTFLIKKNNDIPPPPIQIQMHRGGGDDADPRQDSDSKSDLGFQEEGNHNNVADNDGNKNSIKSRTRMSEALRNTEEILANAESQSPNWVFSVFHYPLYTPWMVASYTALVVCQEQNNEKKGNTDIVWESCQEVLFDPSGRRFENTTLGRLFNSTAARVYTFYKTLDAQVGKKMWEIMISHSWSNEVKPLTQNGNAYVRESLKMGLKYVAYEVHNIQDNVDSLVNSNVDDFMVTFVGSDFSHPRQLVKNLVGSFFDDSDGLDAIPKVDFKQERNLKLSSRQDSLPHQNTATWDGDLGRLKSNFGKGLNWLWSGLVGNKIPVSDIQSMVENI